MKKIIIIICLGLILTGCDLDIKSEINKIMDAKIECEITNQYREKYGFTYYIEGKCTNVDNKKYSIVSVEYECFDKDENYLESFSIDREDFEKEEVWDFTIKGLSDTSKDIDHCKYSGIIAW